METILIAEDNSDDYFILEHAFRRADFEVEKHRVRDGVEARDYLTGKGPFADRQSYPFPALIVSDLKMPRMNGLELLRWTRQQPVLRRVPFILLSASGSPADITAAYDGFANSYHVKPTAVEDLVALLKHVQNYWFKATVRPCLPEDFSFAQPQESS